MARGSKHTTEREGMDYLYYTARRIHRLADSSLARRGGSRSRGAYDDPHADAEPPRTAAQRAVAGVAERFAAGMIVAFGGRQMVDSIGRWVDYAGRKRRTPG